MPKTMLGISHQNFKDCSALPFQSAVLPSSLDELGNRTFSIAFPLY